MKVIYDFTFYFATFSLQNITGLDAGLDLISANQIREFGSSQSL